MRIYQKSFEVFRKIAGMKIIQKIEISKFRSIYRSDIETDELNIFSGKNNQGKSNVLKALNLFFNGESSFNQEFEHARDFNVAYTGQAGGRREIVITLFFSGQGSGALKDDFYIIKKFDQLDVNVEYHSTNVVIEEKIEKDGNIKRQFTAFLHQLEYFYVPAIRDRGFVQRLLLQFERLLEDTKGKVFQKKIIELSDILKEKSDDISSDFQQFINLPTSASLSTSVKDVLNAVRIFVKSGIKISKKGGSVLDGEVDLFSSGDGILMSYIPHFLTHVFSRVPRKKFILGFEEPENSLEYSKIQNLAVKFHTEFSKYAQIFITTHSPAFIKLREQENVNFFRVYINPDDPKQVSRIETTERIENKQQSLFKKGEIDSAEYKALCDEIAFVEQSIDIENFVEQQWVETQRLVKARTEFEKKNARVLRLRPNKIFVCEDSDRETIKLWKKMIYNNDIKVISSSGCKNDDVEIWVKQNQALDTSYKPQVFRQVDKDGLDWQRLNKIKEVMEKKFRSFNYLYSPLPVNEIENFAVLSNATFNEQFWDKNKIDVINHFENCVDTSVDQLDRFFSFDEPLFRNGGNGVKIMQNLRNAALLDWKKLFPGKKICEKLQNFDAISYLSGLDRSEYPQEMKEYIQSIKDFFSKSETV
jgi:AAA15 family ATPase/GTPase